MKRSDKQAMVEKIVTLYSSNDYVFMLNYKGVKADDIYNIRKSILTKTGDKVLVVKNSLHRVALEKLGLIEKIDSSILSNQVALIFTNDILGLSSLLKVFVNKKSVGFIAYFDKNSLSNEGSFATISSYDSIESLRSCLLGTLSNSYSGIVRLLTIKSSI